MSTTKEQFTIKGIHGDSTMNRATYEDYQRALKSRRALGRYTLEEAALFVCEQQTGEHPGNAKKILKMLMDGARAGTLQIYNPDSRCPRSKEDAQQVWHAIEEAYWSDLNEWIRVNAKFLDCKFPKPDAPAEKVEVAPSAKGKKGYWEGEVKRNGGRYQLTVAAWFIADCTTADADRMRDKLFKAAGTGGLKVYEPGKHEEYQFNPVPNWKSNSPLKDNEVFLEAYWNALNEWLEKNEPRLDFRFPSPNKLPADKDATKQKRQRQDALAVELDKILVPMKTPTPAKVMAKLREQIGKPNTCILSNAGDGIKWENDKGDVKTIKINALGERIREWKKTSLSQG